VSQNSPFQLEVSIKKLKTRYKATTSAFPKCSGLGATEREALLSLSKSITKHISQFTQTTLEKLLVSNAYTEIMFNLDSPAKETKKVFSLDPNFSTVQKTVSIHPNSNVIEHLLNSKVKHNDPDIYELFEEFEEPTSKSIEQVISQILEKHLPDQQSEGLVFGFPMSLN